MGFLNDHKIKYIVELTNNTMVIKVESLNKKYIVSDAGLKMSELGFIRMVKTRAEKNTICFPKVKRSEITYYRFRDIPSGMYRDIIEVDINKAYWEIAYRENIIDLETYRKGKSKKTSKRSRLIALGSLATVKTIFEFDGERHNLKEIRNSDLTRNYFFHISKKVDEIMNNIKAAIPEDKFYFFWVDAFFVCRAFADQVGLEVKKHGLEFKTKDIKWMKVEDERDGKRITLLEHKKTIPGSHSEISFKPFKITNHSKRKREDVNHFNKTVIDMQRKISNGIYLK